MGLGLVSLLGFLQTVSPLPQDSVKSDFLSPEALRDSVYQAVQERGISRYSIIPFRLNESETILFPVNCKYDLKVLYGDVFYAEFCKEVFSGREIFIGLEVFPGEDGRQMGRVVTDWFDGAKECYVGYMANNQIQSKRFLGDDDCESFSNSFLERFHEAPKNVNFLPQKN